MNDSPALDLSGYVSKLSLSAAEKTAVTKATSQIAAWHSEAAKHNASNRQKVKDLSWEVSQGPTPENIAQLAEAARTKELPDEVGRTLKVALAPAINRQIDTLAPVALRCLDELEAALKADSETHAATVAKSPFSADTDSGEVGRRLDKTLAMLEGERERVRNSHAALELLCRWDLARDPAELALES